MQLLRNSALPPRFSIRLGRHTVFGVPLRYQGTLQTGGPTLLSDSSIKVPVKHNPVTKDFKDWRVKVQFYARVYNAAAPGGFVDQPLGNNPVEVIPDTGFGDLQLPQ